MSKRQTCILTMTEEGGTEETDRLTLTCAEVAETLDLAQPGDLLSVGYVNAGRNLTARISGPVIAAPGSGDPAVGIDLFTGAPVVIRESSGTIWGEISQCFLLRGDEYAGGRMIYTRELDDTEEPQS